jgi:spore germination protein GerM
MALAALAATACGVGTEGAPHTLDPKSVPFGLLAPATSTTTTTRPAETQLVIYLFGSQSLVPVTRTTPAPVTAQAVLQALSSPPTPSESNAGLTSPISSATPLKFDSARAGTVAVDVPASFESLGGQDQIVAAAQLVFSLTAVSGTTGVVILVGGQPAQVPTSGGGLSQGPLIRADYAPLGPG